MFISNKYFETLFSESNISIRLIIPLVMYLLFDHDKIVICLVNFLIIIIIRMSLSNKLIISSVVYTFIFCLCSNFVSPVISACLYEFCIFRINPSENPNNNFNLRN